jgi:UDP-N-acetylmuramoyl-L-alanyl-D-glutamate--2,6-diaminopimelate ligase
MMAAAAQSFAHTLAGLLEGMLEIAPAQDPEVASLTLDSRQVEPGCLFLACAGGRHHGLAFARQAQALGAVAVLWEPDGAEGDRLAEALRDLRLPLLPLPGLSQRASEIAARFYGDPSRELKIYGITGTNGKTSISQLLAQALEDDAPCGMMGTLGYGFPHALQATGYTTPDAVTLQRLLASLKAQGAEAVTMEVSSHALDQGRAAAVHFDAAIFTNLSMDHFDYHGSFENYEAAKRRLFEMPGLTCAVVNLDDEVGERMLDGLAAGVERLAYTLDADRVLPEGLAGWVRVAEILPSSAGMEIRLLTHLGEGLLKTRLLGRFNAANLSAVLLVLLHRGWSLERALRVMQGLTTVSGRMQLFGGESQPTVVVDYAHTPDALEKALQAVRLHCSGRLIAVFGCGGDRDRGKRPLMGALAERLADQVYVTDDNPRSEASQAIIGEILAGLERPAAAKVVPDRAQAIREAILDAHPGDLVLVAGKGHEDYQLVGDLTLHFDDREQVAEALAAWREMANE